MTLFSSLWKCVTVRDAWVQVATSTCIHAAAHGQFYFYQLCGDSENSIWSPSLAICIVLGFWASWNGLKGLDFESCSLVLASILGISYPKYVGVMKTKSWFLLPCNFYFLSCLLQSQQLVRWPELMPPSVLFFASLLVSAHNPIYQTASILESLPGVFFLTAGASIAKVPWADWKH